MIKQFLPHTRIVMFSCYFVQFAKVDPSLTNFETALEVNIRSVQEVVRGNLVEYLGKN